MGCGVFKKELGPRMCSYFMHCDRRIVFPGGLGFLYFHHGEFYFAYNIAQVSLSTMNLTI